MKTKGKKKRENGQAEPTSAPTRAKERSTQPGHSLFGRFNHEGLKDGNRQKKGKGKGKKKRLLSRPRRGGRQRRKKRKNGRRYFYGQLFLPSCRAASRKRKGLVAIYVRVRSQSAEKKGKACLIDEGSS